MRFSTRLLLLAFCIACAGVASAAEDGTEIARIVREALDASEASGTNDAPRVVRYDGSTQSQRALPGYRNETTEIGYRWWLSRGRADLGLGLGTMTYGTRPSGSLPGLGSDTSTSVLGSATVMTVGMRYRTSDRATLYADASGVRGHGFDAGEAVVGKVGVEFKAAQSQFNIAYGGLGVRLAGDTRMTLRIKRGGLGVVMRRAF